MKPIITVDEARALPDMRLLDARAQGYREGHLEGALQADLEVDLSTPADPALGGRHPLPALSDWTATVGRWGIDPDTPVVIYDDRGGVLAAARAWWMFRAIGHTKVAVLEGGMQAALDAGWPTSMKVPQVEHQAPYPAERWLLPTIDAEGVHAARSDAAWTLVDVRAPERYEGRVEPIDPVAGHIAGAINLPCADNLDADGTFKSAEALRGMFADLDPEHTIVSCGSGVTACHTLLAMDLAGLPIPSLYVGSWSEWCRKGWPSSP